MKANEFPEGLRLVTAGPEHRGFVISTWVRSYWEQRKRSVSYPVFMSGEPKLAEQHFHQSYVLTSDGSSIHGWVCGKRGLLHYVYVPTELRNSGFGYGMVLAICGEYPDYTRENKWLRKKVQGQYNPYRLWE